jgi:hypothetical protein
MNPGFKFYTKDGKKLFELLSVEKRHIHVAHGILGDKYQTEFTIKCMDKDGKIYNQNNLTNKLNDGNIYTIAYIEQDWDSLIFRTVESVEKEKQSQYMSYRDNLKIFKEEYKRLLQQEVDNGNLTELEMYKKLAEAE